jgi:hypothetical protein
MFIGERECAFMRALRAQTYAQHYISSIGAQAAVLIETQIATNIGAIGTIYAIRRSRVRIHACAFMRALRAQTCAQHYISSVGAQTAGLNETPIGTNTHWGNRHKLFESAYA